MNKEEQKTLMELFGELEDRREGNAIRYRLDEVLMIGVLCILCNGKTFTAMEIFGKTHLNELREFMELEHGVPSHDTFGDIFCSIDPDSVAKCFEIWLTDMKQKLAMREEKGERNDHVVAIDGKTIRRSQHETHKAHHVVTAYCSDLKLVLGQLCTEEKSNEITAIPELLKLLSIKGCTVTIDAMGTQKEIASAIRDKGADYILAVKGNQGDLYEFVQLRAKSELTSTTQKELKEQGRYAKSIDKGHGRIETRECLMFPDMEWYDRSSEWRDIAGFAIIRSTRETDEARTTEDRYYIYSREGLTAGDFLNAQRSHWAIENSLHWTLDVTFQEDSAHIRLGNAAVVLNIFRKLVLQMLKADTTVKGSAQSKLLRCAWDFNYALSVVRNYAFPS